jgi:hypothetical protein
MPPSDVKTPSPFKLGGAAPTNRERDRALRRLRFAVFAQLVLYGALIVIFTNVPHGWQGVLNYGLEGVDAFREAINYPTLKLSPTAFMVCGYATFVALWAFFALAVQAAVVLDRQGSDRRAIALVLGGAIAQHAVLVFLLPPVLSQDLYHYAAFGRMVAFSGFNPYTTPIESVPYDPVTTLADWRQLTSHYGAFFTWVSAAAAWIGGDSPVKTAWAFKGVAALANLGVALGAYRLAREGGEGGRGGQGGGLAAATLCALGPAFVIESAGSGHNEAIMMALAVAGMLWWRRGSIAGATVAFTLSVLVKGVTGGLFALLVLRAFAQPAPGTRRLALVAKVAVTAAVVTFALYAHFGWTPASWGVGASRDLLVHGQSVVGGDAPSLLGPRALVFGAAVLGALGLAGRARRPLELELAAVLSLLFVLVVFEWRYAWYFIPAATLAVIAPPSKLRRWLRLVTFGLAFGWSLAYPAIHKKHSALFQPFAERAPAAVPLALR